MHCLPFDVKNLLLPSNEGILISRFIQTEKYGVSRKFRYYIMGKNILKKYSFIKKFMILSLIQYRNSLSLSLSLYISTFVLGLLVSESLL